MTTKTRYPLAFADEIAAQLRKQLDGSCERIQVAGSIRRRRPDVGDIELLCIPRHMEHRNLLGEVTATADLLDYILRGLMTHGVLAKRPNINGNFTFGPLNKLMVHQSGIWVDVFTATAKNWGRDLLIRTGSADFNRQVMSRFLGIGKRGHAYGDAAATLRNGELVCAPDEETMFNLLEWPWIEPAARE